MQRSGKIPYKKFNSGVIPGFEWILEIDGWKKLIFKGLYEFSFQNHFALTIFNGVTGNLSPEKCAFSGLRCCATHEISGSNYTFCKRLRSKNLFHNRH